MIDAVDTFNTNFVWLLEISGNTPQIDVAVANVQATPGTGTDAITSTNLTPTTATSLLLGFTCDVDDNGGTLSVGTGFTNSVSSLAEVRGEYRQLSSSSAVAATFTHSVNATHLTMALAIKEAAPPFAGAAADIAAAAGALTTQIAAAANANDVTTVAGALSTAIRVATNAVSIANAAGALLTGVKAAGAAADVAAAIGALSTSIQCNGAAIDVAVASGALTNWTTVTLAGTLYTGVGGVLDPNFWLDAVPAVGDTLYYDATHITIATNGEISSDTNPCTAVVQFNNGSGWAVGIVIFTPYMVGYAVDQVSAAGALSAAIRLAGAANAIATITGSLSSTQAALSGNALMVATAAAALTAQIKFDALAAAVSTGLGAMSTQINISAASSAVSSAQAAMTTATPLNGPAAGVSFVSGALSTAIKTAGNAVGNATAAGEIEGIAHLIGAAIDMVTSLGLLNTGIDIQGNALNIVNATADLTARVAVFGESSGTATATAMLDNLFSIVFPPRNRFWRVDRLH